MFRLENNVPSTYIENSRDFQLLVRLYDSVFTGVRFDENTIPNILDPRLINDRMLDLYATKVGFFTNTIIDSKILREILQTFPYAIKNKGNKKGIEQAVYTILKTERNYSIPQIVIDNDNYSITIYTSKEIKNKKALEAFLEYIIPIGYTYSIEQFISSEYMDKFKDRSVVSTVSNPSISTSTIFNNRNTLFVPGADGVVNDLPLNTLSSVDMMQVISNENYLSSHNYIDGTNIDSGNNLDEIVLPETGNIYDAEGNLITQNMTYVSQTEKDETE